MGDNLLFGPKGLTEEEEALREALIAWAQRRLDEGARPIPLYAALMIVTDMMRTCEGFERPKRGRGGEYDGWRGESTETSARAALKQIIEISAGPIRRIAEEGLA